MAPTTLLDWLVQRYPTAKRQTLKQMVAAGRVRVNGAVAVAGELKQPIAPSDRVEVSDRPMPARRPPAGRGAASAAPGRPPFRVVHEDADVLVVDKPAGLLTSTVPREPRPTLLAAVRAHVAARVPRARVGLIHRLDRDASGLLVFSKNDAAYRSLKTQFFHHTVERTYLAVVHGVPQPPEGRIETRLVERADGVVYAPRGSTRGEEAVTDYEVIRPGGGRSLVRVTLRTGRKHQIRVHLSGRGAPIVGDVVYGKQERGSGSTGPSRLMLAAVRLSIDHPRTGERMTFEIPPPKGFE